MGTGYTRADTANNIADGNIINASDLDSEYDAIQSAFDASTGHTHDGTAGEGAPIETIGPSQDVVATASVLRPKTDNTVDLGTTSLEYKDLFLDGTAHIDTLDVDENASITGTLGVTGTTTLGTANITTGTITTADINGGNIDGTIIGATSAAAITGTTITGTSFVTSGNMTFGDNDKAVFGAGSDLQIYHDGSSSRIVDAGTGSLKIQAENFAVNNVGDTENMITAVPDGAVQLFYDNSSKLATTSTGIDVTGNATFADNGKAIFGAGSDLQIYHDGSNSYIHDNGIGSLKIRADQLRIESADGSETLAVFNQNSDVFLRHDNETRLATTSAGIDVTGTVTLDDTLNISGGSTTGFLQASGSSLQLGASTSSNFILYTNNAERMRINSSGNVGIGVSSISGVKMDVLTTVSDNLVARFENSHSTGSYGISVKAGDDSGNYSADFANKSGTSLMRIRGDGNVGVGATSPENPLHVSNSTATSQILVQGDSNDASIKLNKSGQTFVIGIDATDDSFRIADNPTLGTNDRLVINSSGNVGIGETSPNQPLVVRNASDGAVIVANTAQGGGQGIGFFTDTTNNRVGVFNNSSSTLDMVFNTGGTATSGEAMRIDNATKYVGIGTSSPSNVLHVHQSDATSNSYVHITQADGGSAATDGLSIGIEDGGVNAVIRNRENGYLRMYTNNSERMRIDSSGNVGIASGGDVTLDSTDIALQVGSGSYSNPTIQIRSSSSGTGQLWFGDNSGSAAGRYDGFIQYNQTGRFMYFGTAQSEAMRIDSSGNLQLTSVDQDIEFNATTTAHESRLKWNYGGTLQSWIEREHSDGSMVFGNQGTERMRIDSSGNLLVGGTDTFPHDNAATSGTAIGASGYLSIARSGGVSGYFNRMTSDGDIMQFRKDGSTVGSIGTYAGDLTIGDDDIGIRFDTGSGLVPWDLGATTTGGSARDAAIDIGVASARFKDLYLSSSIKITGSGDKSISLTSGTGSTSVINMGDGDDIDAGQIVYDNANNSMQVKTNGTERMRIDSSGNLLVGTTSVFSGSGIVPLVTITGATGGIGVNSIGSAEVGLATRPSASHNYYAGFFLNNSGSGVGNITVTGSSTAYNTSSDHRLKENVVDLTGATARLNQLAPKRFNFIADADTTVDGFIAHEVQAVVPEAITGTHNEVDADGNPVYQGIDQSKLVPLLVATIKELEARITALENA